MTYAIAERLRILGDQIAGLSLQEARALSGYLHRVHGIEPAKPTLTIGPQPDPRPPLPLEPAVCDVVLEAFEQPQKLHLVRALRALLELSLKDAADLVRDLPVTVKQAVDREEAQRLQEELERVGGRIVLH